MVKGVQSARMDEPAIECLNCGSPFRGFPSIDPGPRKCSECRTEIFMITTMNRDIVVDMERAPDGLREFIEWARTTLRGMEFLQLMLDLEVMFCGEHKDPPAQRRRRA